jgi:peptidoglycan/LPS O-acetylase OafA/YrhL
VTGHVLPALDGVRALAIVGVIAYHLNLGWASGGYLGVDLFFVLSGFLITSLLVEEWVGSGRIVLGRFWGRRARRLLPALFLVLAAIMVFIVVYDRFGPSGAAAQIDLSGLRGDALATLFYVANWHSIFAHQSYFARFTAPSPLEHTWSLAIEEQFYIVWPLVVLGVLHFFRRTVLLGVAVVGAVASAVWMAALWHPLGNLTRLYYGTDTHAQSMLVGASLAIGLSLWADRRRRAPVGENGWAPAGDRVRLALMVIGAAGFVVTGLLWWRVSFTDRFLWQGGFFVAALATAAVLISVVTVERGPVAVFLAWTPLRFLGRSSYGM